MNSNEVLVSSYDEANRALRATGIEKGYSNVSGANAANVETLTAVEGVKHHLVQLSVSVVDAATAVPVVVTVADGVTVVYSFIIPEAAPAGSTYSYSFEAAPLTGTINTDMVVTVPALGVGSKSLLSIVYYTE